MTSKGEQILDRLTNKIRTLESCSLHVYRNLDKPQKIPSQGLIILRDGTSGEPEILLSPLTYIYEHLVTVELIVQHCDPQIRSGLLDHLLLRIGKIIQNNRTLDGLAEWIEARAPEFQDEPIEGAASIRAATVQIMVRFFTSDPLN